MIPTNTYQFIQAVWSFDAFKKLGFLCWVPIMRSRMVLWVYIIGACFWKLLSLDSALFEIGGAFLSWVS